LLDQVRNELEGTKVEHTGKDGAPLPTPIINIYGTKATANSRNIPSAESH
jgi:hypothetical protein